MNIDCKYWTKERDWGICSLGLYGGKPSFGVCVECELSKNKPRRKVGVVEKLHNTVVRVTGKPCGNCKDRAVKIDKFLTGAKHENDSSAKS